MQVERIEIYDFKVVFTQKEFNDMILLQPVNPLETEFLVRHVIKAGLAALEQKRKSKET